MYAIQYNCPVSAAASEGLPRNVDHLISETHNWFSRSATRQTAYKKVFNHLSENRDPLKIVQSCRTRWLSIATVVESIHDQWSELKIHFDIACQEKCFAAQLLYEIYSNDTNLAYIKFLLPVLRFSGLTNHLNPVMVTQPNY